MPYKSRIKTLEESHRLVDNQLFQLEKSGVGDSDKIQKLRETKQKYLSELQQLRRAQWDYDHERVDFDDDR
jgi:flagellar biosynthesis/type III secretory pathway chaperone